MTLEKINKSIKKLESSIEKRNVPHQSEDGTLHYKDCQSLIVIQEEDSADTCEPCCCEEFE